MSIIGVPNTTTFSLADVIAAVNPSSNDLQECFNDAVSNAFNATYDEDKDELDDFRDYGNNASAQNTIYIANSNYTISTACGASRTFAVLKNNNPATVSNGDKIWLTNGSIFPGNTDIPDLEYYGFGSGVTSVRFQISSAGVVYNVSSCSSSLTLTSVLYDDTGGFTGSQTLYYDSSIGDAENLQPGDILYTNSSLSTPLGSNPGTTPLKYYQYATTATTTICDDGIGNSGHVASFELTNSTNGVISWIACGYL